MAIRLYKSNACHKDWRVRQEPWRKLKAKFGKIGILMGGPSSERDVSLKSGKAVYKALKAGGFWVKAIDIKTDKINRNIALLRANKIERAFLALHGRFGEDGQIQGILDLLKIPYTGSSAKASRLAMDKVASRKIFARNGLMVPRYRALNKPVGAKRVKFRNDLGWPLVVKPVTHGSSIGLSIVKNRKELDKAIGLALSFDKRIIIEEYIKGRELTVGILAEQPLPVIEIIPKNPFFDYDAKYHSGKTEYVVPARIGEDTARKVKTAALRAHKLLSCSGCSRVDIILSKTGRPYILEINTIPGFTATSLLPKAAGCKGIDFVSLCVKLIGLSDEKR